MDSHPVTAALHQTWQRDNLATPLLMAHRGAPTEQPENTLASFRAALDAGADVIEMDVRTTRDGELVVIHDATIDRVSLGQGAVDALSLAEIRAWPLRQTKTSDPQASQVPRLKDVFAAFPTAAMNVDLKDVADHDVPKVFDWFRTIKAQPASNLRVVLTSSEVHTQAAIAAHNSEGLVTLGMGRDDVVEVLKAAWLWKPPIERLRGHVCQMPAHHTVFGVNIPLLRGPLLAYLKAMDSPVHVWWDEHGMVDDQAQLEKCRQWGVDGIFTNDIRAMVGIKERLDAKRP